MANSGDTIRFFASPDPEAQKRLAARRAEEKRQADHPGLSITEAAQLLETSVEAVRTLIEQNRIPVNGNGKLNYRRLLARKKADGLAPWIGYK